MKMFRVALVSKKSYRNGAHNIYKALVLAETKEEALAKVEASIHMPLSEYGNGYIKITETGTDVYTF